MTRNWHNPAPTPAELAAWADGELDPATAGRVEAWLADHPEAAPDAESWRRLVQLYRDHAAPDPSPVAWQTTLARIEIGLDAPPRRPLAWRLRLVAALTAAAAVLGGVLVATLYTPRAIERPVGPGFVADSQLILPPEDDNDEPFPVLTSSEIDIISMDVADVDRLVLEGRPLLGPIEFCRPPDVKVVRFQADPDEAFVPRFQPGSTVPMIVVARADDDEEEP
jgi:hypothetical protein